MARRFKKTIFNSDTAPHNTEKKQVSNVRKLKLLITVIDRSKTLFYVDLLEQFEVNVQMVLYGRGTANSQMRDLLGLVESEKSVIISYIREDKIKEAMETLDEKFHKVKNGKGIAYTVALDSIIGVSMYQLLSNDRTVKEGDKK
ncbi:MAG: hypothetical protein IJV70_00810 [Clostridia bacterium]|nr:hypothetical protein [Clostridia bacterium]